MSDTTFPAGGRVWRAEFTAATEAAVRAELGASLAKLSRLSPGQVVGRLKKNMHLLGGLVYLAVRDQCEERGVAPEDFARSLNYAVLPGALMAVLRALAARYPASRLARGLERYDLARG